MSTLKLTIASAALVVLASTSAFALDNGDRVSGINNASTNVYTSAAAAPATASSNVATPSIRDQADVRGQ